MTIANNTLTWMLLAMCTVSILISIPRRGKIAWARKQFVTLAWMSYIWLPALATLLLIKYFDYW